MYALLHADAFPKTADTIERNELIIDNQIVRIREIRAEDKELERQFIESLSPRSSYYRFMGAMSRPTEAMLRRLTRINFNTDMAYIATIRQNNDEKQIGVGRYVCLNQATCEFAIAVSDEWQGRGLGSRIMAMLISSARKKRYQKMVGTLFSDNRTMISFVEDLGFTVELDRSYPVVSIAELHL